MISSIYRSFLRIGLMSLLSFTLVFGVTMENSWANPAFMLPPSMPIATIERVKADAKDLEGKTQEAIGNVTGNAQNQITGKAKQAEAVVRNATEDIKDNVPERVKAMTKEIEGKTQEAIGKMTGSNKDQITGQAKQAEGKTRNLLENVKDKVQGLLD
ncbi:CsbD family protein [Pseudanabaena mucicola]|uniref:CsbD family protein n=1 Tax=Pseudanabaena mucicola FACHB-723 TaxID=2692860 RepID=A0ABR7ZVA9_9CYAN|nr:CsbD family protein [Pseudanabaena mucicola]MBD2187430.1 CsbD family protein [Pseudanabaena mucicola FACHB-723]